MYSRTLTLLGRTHVTLKNGDALNSITIDIKFATKSKVNTNTFTDPLGLPPEAIRQFKKICERKGIKLSNTETTKQANDLINLFRVVFDES